MYFPGFGYAEILRCVNLESLIDKNNVGTHRLNYLLPDKRHTEYNIRRENVYPLPVTRTNAFRNSFIPCSEWALYNCQ